MSGLDEVVSITRGELFQLVNCAVTLDFRTRSCRSVSGSSSPRRCRKLSSERSRMPSPEFRPTARLTAHARQRCLEMGITTARVKRVVRDPDLSYMHRGLRVVCRNDEPDFRCVVDGFRVVTVLPWSYQQYERAS